MQFLFVVMLSETKVDPLPDLKWLRRAEWQKKLEQK